MEKKIRKRYHSEEAVKKALKIESFRNLTKDKVMEFTSMIPYMEKEVALEIIKQFPVYVEFVESAIENYTQLCKTILETNKEEYEQAVHAHQYVLETFANQLEQENLTEEERRDFSEKMIEEADKITELYLQQQKFHERVFKTIGGVVTLALGVTVTMLGLKAIENYTQLCKTILETNKEEYEQAVHAHQYVLETFANQLEQENLTEEERRDFSEKMIEEADKITELYLQQQKFHERVFKTIGGVVTLALGVTVTMLGLKAIGSDEDLPQLDDENQNVA